MNYQLNRYMSATAGYGFVNTYPYGDFPGKITLPEHRFFEQIWVKHSLGRLGLQHRFRVELRFMRALRSGNNSKRHWDLRQRFRYMLRGDVPVSKRFYIGLYDEFFLNFGGNRGLRYLGQNRAYAAFGVKISRSEKFELGYLHQYIPQRSGRVFEHNHTRQIALFSSRPFRHTGEGKYMTLLCKPRQQWPQNYEEDDISRR